MATGSALDQILDPVTACFTPQVAERIVDLHLDPDLTARIEELARQADDGTLTAAEDAEYKDFIEAGDMLALLQAKARRFLQQHTQ